MYFNLFFYFYLSIFCRKYCTSLHFKTHELLSKKKNRSVETTAVNNGQKMKLALKSQERCRRTGL